MICLDFENCFFHMAHYQLRDMQFNQKSQGRKRFSTWNVQICTQRKRRVWKMWSTWCLRWFALILTWFFKTSATLSSSQHGESCHHELAIWTMGPLARLVCDEILLSRSNAAFKYKMILSKSKHFSDIICYKRSIGKRIGFLVYWV